MEKRESKLFCRKLNSMVSEEDKSPDEYEKLKMSTRSQDIRGTISNIQNDERRHHRMLLGIRKNHCD